MNKTELKQIKKIKVEKCIQEAIRRFTDNKFKMNTFAYISYFVKRNELSFEDDLYIRNKVQKYIDENVQTLCPICFTINEKWI
ncbi:MAG: hypothetical protein HFJ48_01335 [Clostridia bacterium]|nr:hypothetical protein [Clostridia bacterium]